VVGGAGGEDLCLSGKAAEGASLDDSLAVALERRARGMCRGRKGPLKERVARVGVRDCARMIRFHHWDKFSRLWQTGGPSIGKLLCLFYLREREGITY